MLPKFTPMNFAENLTLRNKVVFPLIDMVNLGPDLMRGKVSKFNSTRTSGRSAPLVLVPPNVSHNPSC